MFAHNRRRCSAFERDNAGNGATTAAPCSRVHLSPRRCPRVQFERDNAGTGAAAAPGEPAPALAQLMETPEWRAMVLRAYTRAAQDLSLIHILTLPTKA